MAAAELAGVFLDRAGGKKDKMADAGTGRWQRECRWRRPPLGRTASGWAGRGEAGLARRAAASRPEGGARRWALSAPAFPGCVCGEWHPFVPGEGLFLPGI